MKQIATDEIFTLLMRIATGETLEVDEAILVREFLNSTKKA